MSPSTNELRWLAFDTSTDVLSLAVARGDRVWTQTLPGGAQASSGLIPAVLALLAEADMPLASLTAIVFGRGPGSFTGLRTACAVAQGLALGADVPVLPIDTLLAVAEEARELQMSSGDLNASDALTVLALLDARMDEVYSAAYHWQAPAAQGGHAPTLPAASDHAQSTAPARGGWQTVSPLKVGAPEQVALPDTTPTSPGPQTSPVPKHPGCFWRAMPLPLMATVCHRASAARRCLPPPPCCAWPLPCGHKGKPCPPTKPCRCTSVTKWPTPPPSARC